MKMISGMNFTRVTLLRKTSQSGISRRYFDESVARIRRKPRFERKGWML